MPASNFLLANPAVRITADITGLQSGMVAAERTVDRGLRGIGNKMTALGGQFRKVGLGITLAMAPFAIAAAKGIQAAGDFQFALAEIQARAGLTDDELQRVRKTALQLGRDTAFSGTEAAQGMLELVAAGTSVTDAIGTIPHVLDLATAGALGLKQAADGVTDVMQVFGVAVGETEDVVNALAFASGNSSATITDLIESFRTGGPRAAMYGLSVEKTAAALAILAENGLKGSEAGTALRSMLLNMSRPTEKVQQSWEELGLTMYTSEGQMRDLSDIMLEVGQRLEGLDDESRIRIFQQLFGAYGGGAAAALAKTDESLNQFMERMLQSATATEVAAGMLDTFRGRMQILGGTVQTMQIEFFTPFMVDILQPFIDHLITAGNAVSDWAAANPELTKTIILIGGAIGGLGIALVGLGFILPLLGAGLSAVAGLLPTLAAVVSGPTALAAGVLASLGGVLAYQEDIGGFRKLADGLIADFETFIEDTDFKTSGELFAMRLARSISTGFSAEGISTVLGGIPQRISDFIFGFDETTTVDVETFLAGTLPDMHAWSTYPAVADMADGYYDGMIDALALAMGGSAAKHQITTTERIPGLLNFATGLVAAIGNGLKAAITFVGGFWPIFTSAMRQLIPSGATLGATVGGATSNIYTWLKDTITDAVDDAITFITGTGPGSAIFFITGVSDALTSAVTSMANFGGGFIEGFLSALGVEGDGLLEQIQNAIFGSADMVSATGRGMPGQAGLIEHLKNAFKSVLDDVVAAIGLYAPKVLAAIVGILPDAAALAVSAVSAAADILAWVVGLLPTGSSFASVVTTAADDIIAWIGGILGAAWAGVIGLFSGGDSDEPGYDAQMLTAIGGILPSLATLSTFATTAAADILSWIGGLLGTAFTGILALFTTSEEGEVGYGTQLLNAIGGMVPSLTELVAFTTTAYSDILDWVAGILKSAWTGIEGLFTDSADGGDGYGTKLLDAIVGMLPSAEQLGAAAGTAVAALAGFVGGIFADIWTGVTELLGGGESVEGSSKSLLRTVVDSLMSAATTVLGAGLPILGDFGKGFLTALGIDTAPIEKFVADVRTLLFGSAGVVAGGPNCRRCRYSGRVQWVIGHIERPIRDLLSIPGHHMGDCECAN